MTQLLKSVRVRMTLAAMGVTATAVALAGWLLVQSVEDTRVADLRREAEVQLNQVSAQLDAGVDPTEAVRSALLPEGLIEVRNESGKIVASNPEVVDAEGNLVVIQRRDGESEDVDGASAPTGDASAGSAGGASAGGATNPTPELMPDPLALCLLDPACAAECVVDQEGPSQTVRCPAPAQGPILGDVSAISAGPSLFVTQETTSLEQTVETTDGPMTVTALVPVSEVERSVEAVRRSLWVLLPGLVGIVALVGWWLTGRALRPVEAIRLEAEAIGGSTIHRRVPVPGKGDEIGRLARTMNAMLERLDHSARRQRQFVSDASHELRSPLAAIRTDVEVALHEGDAADWPTVATAVLEEEGRLETLLADLLVLAADDEGKNGLRQAPVDMAELVTEVVDGREIAAQSLADGVTVSGNVSQLRRALGNLVTNARRHATSRVEVGLARVDGRVRITVDDDGPGIPAADRDRVFERFTRLDNGRTRDQGGSGLGLAVVRSIVVRHGGRVWADASPLGGARFTIDLPAG